MTMSTFGSILEASPEEMEASLPLPTGEYEFSIVKAAIEKIKKDYKDQSRREGDEILVIYAKPVAAIEVDEEELELCEDWRNEFVSLRIFPDEMGDRFCDMKSERGFVYHAGLDPKDFIEAGTMAMIEALKGNNFAGTVVHSPNPVNPDKPYVNLRQTAPL